MVTMPIEGTTLKWPFWVGLIFAVAIMGGALWFGFGFPVAGTLFATGLCAFWWMTEPIPIAATSLIPFVVLPLCGALDDKLVAQAYGHPMILLLMGGFFLSVGIERAGAHRRMALAMLRLIGTNARRLILGFMVATAVCSMWISNTATTLMLLPVATAVLGTLPDHQRESLSVPCLLGIAYAASIGGMATPIGTPPNVILMGVLEAETGRVVGFAEWMQWGLPLVCIALPVAWIWLSRGLVTDIKPKWPVPEPWRAEEYRILAIFGLTASLWIARPSLGLAGVGDSTIALGGTLLMFLVPAKSRPGALLTWTEAVKIPWGLGLLFGGGIALAKAFGSTGISEAVGSYLVDDLGLLTIPVFAMMLGICLCVTFLTEVTSNTATTTLLMPILVIAAIHADIDPLLLMLPAAISASCAFMLPVATAPNAIVYGTGAFSVARMAKEGLILNVLCAFICAFWLTTVL